MKLTFILPCYNVERYISRCLDSIFAIETMNAGVIGSSDWTFEVVCVLEPCQDTTPDWLQFYVAQHPNMRVVTNVEQLGSGLSREEGLLVADGDYVWFADSDDEIVPAAVEQFITTIEQDDLDVLAFNFDNVDENGYVFLPSRIFKDTLPMEGCEFVNTTFGNRLYNHVGFAWRFIYKKSFLIEKNIHFPKGLWEDALYMLRGMIEANRIASVSATGYRYWHHTTSLCRQYGKTQSGKDGFDFYIQSAIVIYQYALSVQNEELQNRLKDIALTNYFGNFPVFLFRNTSEERTAFYSELKKREVNTVPLLSKGNIYQRLLLLPTVGRYMSEIGTAIYRCKKQRPSFVKKADMSNEVVTVAPMVTSPLGYAKSNLTIIVPVYNAEKYLGECLQSIANQTHKDFLCLLVNDGSTDHSQQVIDEFCSRDNRFVSLLKNNEKSADLARYYALQRTTSEWIMHIDADDVIVPDFVKRMLKRQKETDADVVCARLIGCEKETEGEAYRIPVKGFDMTCTMSGYEAFLQNIGGWAFSANAGVLYRKKLTENIPYKGNINSDEFSQRLLLYYADKVAFEDVHYLYRANEGISETFSPRIFSRTMTDIDLVRFLDYCYPYQTEKKKLIRKQYLLNLIHLNGDYYTHTSSLREEEKSRIQHILRTSYKFLRADIGANRQNYPPLYRIFARFGDIIFAIMSVLYVKWRRKKGRVWYYK